MTLFLKRFLKPDSNTQITKMLLDTLNVNATTSSLKKEITEHPNYPSLLSISDILTSYGVETMTMKVDSDDLEKLPLPLIAITKNKQHYGQRFTIIKGISDKFVEHYDEDKNNWRRIPRDQFLEDWASRIVLIVDAENATAEKDFKKNRNEERRQQFRLSATFSVLPLIAILSMFSTFVTFGTIALPAIFFTLLMLAGSLVSGLLIWYELDQHNPGLRKICGAGKKVNCGAVLNSKASKIAGFSWSEIGGVYFFGGLLFLLFSDIYNQKTLFIVGSLNILAAPYILFSLYYQWRIARQWCMMCLCVQGLLLLGCCISIIQQWLQPQLIESILSVRTIVTVCVTYATPFITLSLLLPSYKRSNENVSNKQSLQRLKHNKLIFESLLSKEKPVIEEPKQLGIVLGNKNARNKIIKVCNPYCGPCAEAHEPIERLLNENDDLQIQIIFTATGQEKDIKNAPVKHLLAIAENDKTEQTIKSALREWYSEGKKNFDRFANKYPIDETQTQTEKIIAMRAWCDKTGIEFTPTFFVNGYQLPAIYAIEDLKYFLQD